MRPSVPSRTAIRQVHSWEVYPAKPGLNGIGTRRVAHWPHMAQIGPLRRRFVSSGTRWRAVCVGWVHGADDGFILRYPKTP